MRRWFGKRNRREVPSREYVYPYDVSFVYRWLWFLLLGSSTLLSW